MIAALTSAISLSEPSIAWMTERFDMSRLQAGRVSSGLLWLLWLLSLAACSRTTSYMAKPSSTASTTNWLMPLGGLMTVLFTGWVLKERTVRDAIGIKHGGVFRAW